MSGCTQSSLRCVTMLLRVCTGASLVCGPHAGRQGTTTTITTHLQYLRHALQAHACVNVLGSQGCEQTLSITVELHKHLQGGRRRGGGRKQVAGSMMTQNAYTH